MPLAALVDTPSWPRATYEPWLTCERALTEADAAISTNSFFAPFCLSDETLAAMSDERKSRREEAQVSVGGNAAEVTPPDSATADADVSLASSAGSQPDANSILALASATLFFFRRLRPPRQ